MTGKPSTKTIQRFPQGADHKVKREFAKELVGALDTIGVKPGKFFVVATEEYAQDVALAEETVEAMQEIVADYRRGLLDRDEMFDRVESYVIRYD